MTEKTKPAQFQRGDEFERDFTVEGVLGILTDTGVVDEVGDGAVSVRYHGSDSIWIFGNHPHAVGPLTELRKVAR
jgi:hypothetical protein